MSKRLVFLESNTTGTGRRFAALARELGLEPLLLASDPARYPYVREDGLEARALDTSDPARVLATCREIAAGPGLAGVGSSSEYFIEGAARAARALGLPHADAGAIARCRDKHAQRVALADAGLATPHFRLADELESGLVDAVAIGYPLVAKPREGSGSIGVKLCASEAELRPHLAGLLEQSANERGIPIKRGALLEELIVGPEFSVEVFDGRAIALVKKHLGPMPFFVEMGHDHPAGVGAELRNALEREAERAAAALGLRFGPLHVELRSSSELGPVVIEVNPRLAGGWIPEMVRLATGIDLVEASVRRFAGLPLDLEPERARAASIRFLVLGEEPAPEVQAEVRALPGVAELALYPPRADASAPRGDFRDRIGHVLIAADTREECDLAAGAALERLRAGSARALRAS